MQIKKQAKIRRRHPSKTLPVELVGRFQSLYEHRNLREQRDTFSSIIKHPGGTYRWNSHLLVLPHYHLIETAEYGKNLRIHVYHSRSENILSIELNNGKWSRKALTPDDKIREIVPTRFSRTGWLAKSASRSQISAVSRITGIQQKALPPITAANANVLIHSSELINHLNQITAMLTSWVVEIESNIHLKAI